MNEGNYTKKQLIDFYETMYKIRTFEESVFELYKSGRMPGLAHLYIGEEAIATGVCAAMDDDDYVGSNHRGHGHVIARGADINRMMAEIVGKETGYCRGKGGTMHIMAIDKNILGTNGIVGGEIPISTGAGYAAKYRGTNQVSVSFFGDSSTNEGTFHESLNMAAAWKLPCVYILENNLYGISVDIRDVTNTPDLVVRAKAYDMPGEIVDGNDVVAVYEAAKKAIQHAREGMGPTLIECKTYRWLGHHAGDPALYRKRKNENEKAEWLEKCPIKGFRAEAIYAKTISEREFNEIEAKIKSQVDGAVKFALDSKYPDEAEALKDIFV